MKSKEEKSVLISIQPKWVEKIASGEKTIEVRKIRPKWETSFKCYIYETKSKQVERCDGCDVTCYGRGKVIGEFVCDRIAGKGETIRGNSCLTVEELQDYCNGKDIYFWRITDLKIYDKPKELSEFYIKCEKGNCRMCDWEREYDVCACKYKKPITRPPQSWCYAEVQE